MKDYTRYARYFSESGFWKKLAKIARKVGSQLIYCSLLLFYTLMDKKVSIKNKALIVGALGYLIFPFDAIPDFIPLAGYTDDMGALIFVIQQVSSNITPEIKQKATEKVKELTGEVPDIKNY